MHDPETPQSPPPRTPLPWWRPDIFAARLTNLRTRAAMTAATRRFFADAGYVEVETPALQVSPGMEPHLTAFETALVAPDGGTVPIHLHTSPEFAMKKLLAAGMDRIFQLARVYRNAERSPKHHPEFTMLEWYRTGAGWRDLAAETEALVRTATDGVLRYRGATADPRAPWEYLSVQDAFRRHADTDLLATAPDPARPDAGLLAAAAAPLGIRTHADDTWDDIFFRIFLERIEPRLGIGAPTVLHSYPASMAALARRSPEDERVADRFEIFVCGLELANGYGELTDPVEQRARFASEIARREALGRAAYPVDEDFMAAMESGLPACAGIALGFDRLAMLATGADRIEDVLWMPVAD